MDKSKVKSLVSNGKFFVVLSVPFTVAKRVSDARKKLHDGSTLMIVRRTFLRHLLLELTSVTNIPEILKEATDKASHLAIASCNNFISLCQDVALSMSNGVLPLIFFSPSLTELPLETLYAFNLSNENIAPITIAHISNLAIVKLT